VDALTLGAEQDQQLGRLGPRAAEPVRSARVELGNFARLHDIVAPRMQARAELLAPLGLTPVEVRLGDYVLGTQIEAGPSGATGIPGVWVAGNLASIQAQVIMAAAAGLAAGAAINLDLVLEEARQVAENVGA
jgi:hypothetical protein